MKLFLKIVIALLLVISGVSTQAAYHPLKMTFSKMILTEDHHAEITTKFFLDDLTEQIKNKYRLLNVDFSSKETNGIQCLQRYLNSNLYVRQKDEKIEFKIIATSFDEDHKVLIVTCKSEKSLDEKKTFELYNTLFFEVFSNQVNHLKYNGKENRFNLRQKKKRLL